MEIPRKNDAAPGTTKQAGDAAEDQALAYLVGQGLKLLARNYRTPGRGGGEIDLVMREGGGTLVFVEVRRRGRERQPFQAAAHHLRRAPLPDAAASAAALPVRCGQRRGRAHRMAARCVRRVVSSSNLRKCEATHP